MSSASLSTTDRKTPSRCRRFVGLFDVVGIVFLARDEPGLACDERRVHAFRPVDRDRP